MEETSVDRTSSVFIQQDGIDRLKRLLCQAIDAERRYIQDWAVVDIDERIQLLQEAVSIFEKVRPSSTGVPRWKYQPTLPHLTEPTIQAPTSKTRTETGIYR